MYWAEGPKLQAIKHSKSERDKVYLINFIKKHKNLISSQNHFKILSQYTIKNYLIQNIINELSGRTKIAGYQTL
jgi:TPP-dependent 2-oxoacid decarboxylase